MTDSAQQQVERRVFPTLFMSVLRRTVRSRITIRRSVAPVEARRLRTWRPQEVFLHLLRSTGPGSTWWWRLAGAIPVGRWASASSARESRSGSGDHEDR